MMSSLTKRRQLTWVLAWGLATSPAWANKAVDSASIEAQGLFKVVMTAEEKPGRCQFDLEWAHDELPDYAAHQIFHFTIRAGLSPPFTILDFRATLDPKSRLLNAFCSQEQLKTYTAQRLQAFERSSDSSMQIDRTTYSFPIFNADFSQAVIIKSSLALEGRSRWDGKIGRHPAGVGSSAEVYRKARGRWRFVRLIELGVS